MVSDVRAFAFFPTFVAWALLLSFRRGSPSIRRGKGEGHQLLPDDAVAVSRSDGSTGKETTCRGEQRRRYKYTFLLVTHEAGAEGAGKKLAATPVASSAHYLVRWPILLITFLTRRAHVQHVHSGVHAASMEPELVRRVGLQHWDRKGAAGSDETDSY